ncbi:MAG TPA: hypothetical protein VFV75_15200 [Candidatus Polarisedimenticolaceae bacterium]|nr:hypothetical protein [Candidatus Polarisedimenticolaceae bacterium]
MQARWVRTLARTLVVCACTTALATAGAHADTKKEAEIGPCSNGPTLPGAVPLETLKSCGGPTEIEPVDSAAKFVQLGPVIVQEAQTVTYNTTSIAGITTLTPFAPFVIPTGDFPADVEILASDPVHIYELMASGTVKSYTTAGTATPVSTVVPPTGETWTDMAVDPTTGTVYATSATSTCSSTSLSSINLLTGVRTPIGTVTNGGCTVALAADNSGNLFGLNIVGDNLIAINKTTGAGTVVGLLGFDANFGQSMDCDPGDGTCYAFAFNNTAFRPELRSVNTSTGATTLVGVIGQASPGGTLQASGAVIGTFGICQVNDDCNDGNLCNGVETCDSGSGNCIPGTPITCDDGEACTLNQCDPATGTCSFPTDPCNDGDPCTVDSCDPVNGCQHSTPGLVHLCNSGSIGIPSSGPGTPYPSTIVAGGLSTSASLCSVELRGLTHTFPDDIDMLLVGPAAPSQNAIVLSDVGGSTAASAVDLVLTDGAASSLPDAGPLVSGTFQPTNIGTGDTFPAPAPAPAGGSSLNVFTGNPNGTWSLYVLDDLGGDLGSVSGGWCINIVQAFCDSNDDCNDGNLCNGVETCDVGSGQCIAGTSVNCDDGDQCTSDACVPATGACTHVPNPCSDGDGCTADSCDPVLGCQHIPQTPVQFCNTGGITIPSSGPGTPYPSSISVSGVGTSASLCAVSLRGLSHTFPDDLDLLIAGPGGATQNTTLMSDAGGGLDVVSVDLNFQDSAAAAVPDGTQIVSGSYKPTNWVAGDTYPAPAPAPQGGTTPNFNAFTGDLNGTWNLFLVDDAGGDLGSVGGWCVSIVVGSCSSDSQCNDGNPCNGIETCVNTQCTPGTPTDCSDGNDCTDDHCDPADGSCFYTATNCADTDGCTADFCDPASGCQHVDHCTEVCTPRAMTIPAGAPTTSSGPADPYPNDLSVNLGPINGVFSLGGVRLLGFTHTFPSDVDVMLSGPGGQNATIFSDVGGGTDVSNIDLLLTDGAPVLPAILVSGTFSPQNIGTADPFPAPAPPPSGGSALSVFNGSDPNGNWQLWVVDDASADVGSLSGGYCLRLLVSCSDDSQCDDGNACTDDACVEGQCASTPTVCDDGNACTDDLCDSGSGCFHMDVVCDDSSACTNDSCDPSSGCVYDTISCDDDNACTDDSCDAASGCVNTNNSNPCDDGNACTAGDACGGGSCQAGSAVDCNDGSACTADSCDPATGCVYTPVDIETNPHARGYWKRLCLGPHSGDELTADDAACVASLGDQFASVGSVADICAVLNGSGNQCTQGAVELMGMALNLCHAYVCDSTPIESQYSDNGTVGESYDQADGILSGGGDCLLAKGLGSEVNTGRAIHVDGVALAKAAGGGARLTWTAMGGGSTPVVKYNVWRRVAGSMNAFVKIGETTTLTFDDVTPGRFEYEVTPVR